MLLAGGRYAVESNVISGNTGAGLHITGTTTVGNTVVSNDIGTDQGGLYAKPNGTHGIHLEGAGSNLIGGTTTSRNVISGNSGDGIRLDGASTGNTVASNYIGLNRDGATALANQNGIQITAGAHDNVIGGTSVARRNLISGNTGYGVLVTGAGADANRLEGNYVGLDGTAGARGNGADGVRISSGAVGNLVGGTATSAANTIANNGAAGVAIVGSGTTGNAVEGNTITANTGLAIDLGGDGVTANDAGDTDAGADNLQNTPALDGAVTDGVANATVVGSLDSTVNAATYPVRIEFFEADSPADASGHGEAARLLGVYSLTAPGAFTASLTTAPAAGKTISAVAIDANGNTSEMASNIACAGPAHHLAFVTGFSNATAGQAFSPAPVVDVCDSAGRRVWTATPQVSVAVTTPASGAPLIGTTTVTAGQGRATFTGVKMNVAGTGRVVTASSSGLTNATSASFNVAAAAADAQHVTLSASSSSVVANNSDLATLTIVVKDQYDNPVAGVAPSSLVVGGTPTTGLTIVQPSAATDANGRTTATAKCSALGSVTFGVALNSTASPSTAAVSFVAGPPVAANTTMTAISTSVTADNREQATFVFTARDASGHPVAGVTASRFGVDATPTTGLTVTQPTEDTDSNGQTTGYIVSTKAEQVTVTGILDSTHLASPVVIDFHPGRVDPLASSMWPDRVSVTADGTDVLTLNFFLCDQYGNPVPNVQPSSVRVRSSSSAGLTLNQLTTATDSGGRAIATATCTEVGSYMFEYDLVAYSATGSTSCIVDFVPGPVDAARSSLTSDRTYIRSDGVDRALLTVIARDALGQ